MSNRLLSALYLALKGYSSARGQSHFSKIKVKLAKKNEFVTHLFNNV